MSFNRLGATSRLALATAASTLAFSATAMAADLGGNCCADLEERVAELEATVARKGNRKVSLTVYGQVNEAVIFWNDGQERNAYVVSNNESRTRFGFRGEAKINHDLTAGYLLEIGVRYAGSNSRNQDANGAGGNQNLLDVRHSAWFLDSKHLGRVWVGHTSSATDGITEISLANINSGSADISNWNNGFFLRNNGTLKSGVTWGNIQSGWNNNVGEGDRVNLIRYISPAFAGFTASASWGEDDRQDIALRWAGEHHGFRMAAGIGFQKLTDFNNGDGNGGCANPTKTNLGVGPQDAKISNVNCEALGMSGSIMHVPTGIFVSGSYGESKDKNLGELTKTTFPLFPVNDKNKHWSVTAGVEQKWFALGKTTLFGEFIKSNSGTALIGGGVRPMAGDTLTFGVGAGITSSEVKTWGLGLNQSIDAANADFYLHFRNISGSINTNDGGTGAVTPNTGIKDFQAVMTGMIIRF
jgi:predicted porin